MSRNTGSENNGSLESLAASLIRALGIEGAIYTCRANYWHGVLKLVQAYRGPDFPLHPATSN
jgi:hypothetical protein